jgi:hypothetical protein
MMNVLSPRRQEQHSCVVRVNNTYENLSAHVELDGDVRVQPGDEVIVHGNPIRAPFGSSIEERRTATLLRAGWMERLWTRMTGDLEFMELLEFSFSSERKL